MEQLISDKPDHPDGSAPFAYDISAAEGEFYCALSDFTDDELTRIDDRIGGTVDRFIAFIMLCKKENLRSRNEYLLEPLIAGILWNEYSGRSRSAAASQLVRLSIYSTFRSIHPALKRCCDAKKGKLLTSMLNDPALDAPVPGTRSFRRFVRWLSATGEFTEEAKRLRHWAEFLDAQTADERREMLSQWSALAGAFASDAKYRLGRFTTGVERVRQNVPVQNFNRENRLFCGRSEPEYHMNMFAAEVMNREFRREFAAARHKVVLLPACMAHPEKGTCRAAAAGGAFTCTGCSASCRINILTRALEPYHVGISIIPHSSGFSRYLKSWAGTGTALVGVACVLNLLRGGYEMRSLGIPSQCVFLDYSGCAKHWNGRATTLSASQLFHILGLGAYHE